VLPTTEEDIRKLWGGNTLRVMGENQRRATPNMEARSAINAE
jgi:hypothetical protein